MLLCLTDFSGNNKVFFNIELKKNNTPLETGHLLSNPEFLLLDILFFLRWVAIVTLALQYKSAVQPSH